MLDGFIRRPDANCNSSTSLFAFKLNSFFWSPFRFFVAIVRNKIKNKICRKTIVIMQIKEIRFLPLGFQIHFLTD